MFPITLKGLSATKPFFHYSRAQIFGPSFDSTRLLLHTELFPGHTDLLPRHTTWRLGSWIERLLGGLGRF